MSKKLKENENISKYNFHSFTKLSLESRLKESLKMQVYKIPMKNYEFCSTRFKSRNRDAEIVFNDTETGY